MNAGGAGWIGLIDYLHGYTKRPLDRDFRSMEEKGKERMNGSEMTL